MLGLFGITIKLLDMYLAYTLYKLLFGLYSRSEQLLSLWESDG